MEYLEGIGTMHHLRREATRASVVKTSASRACEMKLRVTQAVILVLFNILCQSENTVHRFQYPYACCYPVCISSSVQGGLPTMMEIHSKKCMPWRDVWSEDFFIINFCHILATFSFQLMESWFPELNSKISRGNLTFSLWKRIPRGHLLSLTIISLMMQWQLLK